MARTYGEVQEASFAEIFELTSGEHTAFIDIGSGHGKLTIAAVQDFKCGFGLGIEKYREPQAVCDELLKGLDGKTRSKLHFVLEDVSDSDLEELLATTEFQQLLIFCNNLAFTQGILNRLSRKILDLMKILSDKDVFLISTVPLSLMQDHFQKHIMLQMSWTEELHESCVYLSRARSKP